MAKTKIVLDADVLIHFSKGGRLATLPDIFKEYDHIVLKPVYEELGSIKNELEMVRLLKPIKVMAFNPTGEERKEYFTLLKLRGKGESASLAYCKFHNDVIGSSNLKDIKDYCINNGITYLTTIDFLYYAVIRGHMTIEEAELFIKDVRSKGSKLPEVNFEKYSPSANI